MFDKKKMHFWRLVFIFGGMTIITLFFLWSSPNKQSVQMMNSSMGSMMKSMHISNLSIYDLTNMGLSNEQMRQMGSMHQNQPPIIYRLSFITTSVIFLLIPLIIGGTIILAIVWLK